MLQRQLPGASWTGPHALHVTLKFLGDTPEEYIESVRATVTHRLEKMTPFVIEVQGFGVFPESKAPRILWTGIASGNEQLLGVAKIVEDSLLSFGFPKEGKSFHPHVTLARIKKEHKRFGQALSQNGILTRSTEFGPVRVERVTLFRSELRPTGSVYTHLWDAPFGGT